MTSAAFWEVARGIYSIALLALGVAFLVVLPRMLQVGRQLAEAIMIHAGAMQRDADNDARLKEMASDVKTIKSDVQTVKADVETLKKAA